MRGVLGTLFFLAIVLTLIWRFTPFGLSVRATVDSTSAAGIAGINTTVVSAGTWMIGTCLAGVAGVLWGAQYGTINSTAGTGYELQVVSAVVVGGVAIFGGSGSVAGAALGALLLSTISSALYVLGISPFWDQAIWGFLLLLAIALDQTITERLTSALRRRNPRSAARTRHE